MSERNDGGRAFPRQPKTLLVSSDASPDQIRNLIDGLERYHEAHEAGMSLRDYFAAHVQADDRLVKCIRAMDDAALEIFALHPTIEREEHITDVDLTNWQALPSEVAKVTRRLEIEALAIARVRYMQADAMLKERDK